MGFWDAITEGAANAWDKASSAVSDAASRAYTGSWVDKADDKIVDGAKAAWEVASENPLATASVVVGGALAATGVGTAAGAAMIAAGGKQLASAALGGDTEEEKKEEQQQQRRQVVELEEKRQATAREVAAKQLQTAQIEADTARRNAAAHAEDCQWVVPKIRCWWEELTDED